MSGKEYPSSFYIGWDVGGWNCDKNSKSRDAIVIIDSSRNLVGKPWRGNLRTAINEATNSNDWTRILFALCKADAPVDICVTLAIDTPLGFSDAFVRLVTRQSHVGDVGSSDTNPYLFRQTERYLFERGLKPLSAIKDMIGSQATKGMHVLSKFAPQILRCGVWSDGQQLTAIEAYPSACKTSSVVKALQQPFSKLGHDDLDDALTCTLVAYLYKNKPAALTPPSANVPVSEGWIWVPLDALASQTNSNRP
jgi:hypothetical protein